MRTIARVLLAALLAGATAPAFGVAPAAAAGTTQVTYLAGGTVYLGAGAEDGLATGDTVTVLHGGRTIAWLRVSAVSSHRASCDTLRTLEPVNMGDTAVFTERERPPSPTPVPPNSGAAPADTTRGTRKWARPAWAEHLHGRVGARYLSVDTKGAGAIRQPALDLRLVGTDIGGAPVDLGLDLRGRRVTFERVGGGTETDDRTRVYQLSLATHAASDRWRLTLGRQISPSLSPVNLFDGALAESRGARWSVGLFSGTQPEPLLMGFSSRIVEGGGYLEMHQRGDAERRWSLGGGAVSSYQGGQPNRDFGFAQAFYLDRRLSAFGAQEVDLSRGWKRALGEPALSATSTYLNANLRLVQGLSLRAGFDNRRNVRLYRDRVTPETEFDDRWRQGAWGGLGLDFAGHVRLGGDGRTSAIGGGERLNGWSGSAELYRLGPVDGVLRARFSRAKGAGIESDLLSLGLGLDPLPLSHLEVTGGLRRTKDPLAGTLEDTRWTGVDLDLALARRLYFDGSYEDDRGGLGAGRQVYSGLSWRF